MRKRRTDAGEAAGKDVIPSANDADLDPLIAPWDVSWVGPAPGFPMPADAVPGTPEEVTDPAMLTGIYDED